jgi:hypothetical protein
MSHNGMLYDQTTGQERPGDILKLWLELRKAVGNVALKQKPGMKFKTRAATDTYDQVRQAADELGILIYPHEAKGQGMVVDSGTLCDVNLTIICQAASDGSCIAIAGYGQGADTQDKAGGKAGTYAFKQALVQALLAGGTKAPKSHRMPDTDDTDTAIEGGVKAKTAKPKAPTQSEVEEALTNAADEPSYRAAVELLKKAAPATQVALKDTAFAARARCIPQPPTA